MLQPAMIAATGLNRFMRDPLAVLMRITASLRIADKQESVTGRCGLLILRKSAELPVRVS